MRFFVEKLQCLMQEDHRALDIINQIATLKDGHYEMALPCRNFFQLNLQAFFRGNV